MAIYEQRQLGPIPMGRKKEIEPGTHLLTGQISFTKDHIDAYAIAKIQTPNKLQLIRFTEPGHKEDSSLVFTADEINSLRLIAQKTDTHPKKTKIIWKA